MSTNKVIINLQKQNDSIYSSLIAKSIQFERVVIPNDILDEEYIKLLNDENNKLKEAIKINKQVSQPKLEKPKLESKPKEKKNDSEDEVYEEPLKKFNTLTNMEELKRGFFNKDYDIFESQVKNYPFKFYKVSYKYNFDKDGVPEFSAKNLLKGFVRNFDDYRKYFMICFRCWKHQDKSEYKYDSLWIVNTDEPLQNIIGSVYDDFEFENFNNLEQFIEMIKKLPETDEPVFINGYTCIGESYVH